MVEGPPAAGNNNGGRGRGRGRGGGTKGRGGGRGGRGRGDGKGKEGNKESSGRGPAGGGKGRGKKNNSNNKGNQAPKEPKLSPEEIQKQDEERRKAEEAEAERKRIEEEQKARQEAREERAKAVEELNARVKEAIDYLQGLSESVAQHKDNRASFSSEALAASRKEFDTSKKSLKSDLKKCTAFVKKIKGGSAWSMKPDDIVRDVKTLNLSRYVEEVVTAVLEAKIKVTDIPVVLALSKAMHERYPAFLPNLVTGLWAVINGKASEENAKLRRVYVRLITEFLLNGLVTDTKQLAKLITEVTGAKDGNYAVTDANVVVAFVKAAGFEIFGTMSASYKIHTNFIERESTKLKTYQSDMEGKSEEEQAQDERVVASSKLLTTARDYNSKMAEMVSERAVSDDTSKEFLKHCKGAHKTLSSSLLATHEKLQKMEKRCEQDRLLAGSLTETREKGLADARKLKESLLRTVEVISDVLDLQMPRLKEEENEEAESGGVGLELWTKGGEEDGADFGPFDDEETHIFYCDVPDLLTTIPPALLGLSQDEIDKRKADNFVKYGSGFDNEQEEAESENVEVAISSEEQLEAAEQGEGGLSTENPEEASEENKDTPHFKLMVLLEQEMPECSRREEIDELAEKFCTNHGTSKNSRKRLIQTLFLVPRTRLDLLTYYSRMAATLSRVWAEIGQSLINELEQQFHGQAKFKKNQNIESRLKTARYIGELTKFRLAPPMVAFRCIRRCLDDFTGANVDVACCVLESCGRYLYRLKHTNSKLTSLMDAMIRLGKAKHLDERSQSLINSAFYTVKPPPSGPKKQAKIYPPLEGYLRHLLIVKLQATESSIAFVSKQLIRCPWGDQSKQCGALICRIMLKACRNGRYKSIQAVAAVAAKLRRHKPEVSVRLLDSVLEELQQAMEFPSFKEQQRTLTLVRLLGELYGVSLASGQLLVHQLFKFIDFGHDIPEALREASERLAEHAESNAAPNSAGNVTRAIQEDEEMEDADLDETPEVVQDPDPVAVSKHSRYDPRVFTPLDPPNSAFRVKLVCTLLETVAKTIITRNTLTKVESFLISFQRYLFTKAALHTDVEFALLDTFDMIDSQWRKISKDLGKPKTNASQGTNQGFPRYTTWLEAHNATVAIEESEAVADSRSRLRLEAMAGDNRSIDGDDTISSDLMHDDEDMVEDDDDASTEDESTDDENDSSMQTYEDEVRAIENGEGGVRIDEEEDDDDEYDDDLESDDDDDEDEEFDEEAYMQQLEAEAFERELRRLTMDALEKGKVTSRGGKVADSMPSGFQVIRKKTSEGENATAFALSGKAGISFQLLKKGNKGKMESKQFYVPSDTNLAAVATKQDDKAAKERDMIKARVLQYEAESAEAEVTGGNVYLEQEKLQVIRNRLSMEEIDRNFGTSGGNLRPGDKPVAGGKGTGRGPPVVGRGHGRGRGRGGRSSGGRSLV